MSETPTNRRNALVALAIVAVVAVGLSGCLDASGVGVDVDGPYAVDTSTSTSTSPTTAADERSASTNDQSTSTPAGDTPGAGSDAGSSSAPGAGEGATVGGTEAPPTTQESTTTGSRSSENAEPEPTSLVAAETEAPAETPTIPRSDADSSTGGATSTTEIPTETPFVPEPEGPARGEVVTDDSVRVLSHDIKDYPDGTVSVGGTLENPTDQPIDRVHATIVLYDESGAELGRETDCVVDVPPGSADTYVVTFTDVDYSDVDRYTVTAFAAE